MILGVTPWTSTTEERDSPATVNSTRSLWYMLFLSNFDHVKVSLSLSLIRLQFWSSPHLFLFLSLTLFSLCHFPFSSQLKIYFHQKLNLLFHCTAKGRKHLFRQVTDSSKIQIKLLKIDFILATFEIVNTLLFYKSLCTFQWRDCHYLLTTLKTTTFDYLKSWTTHFLGTNLCLRSNVKRKQ